MARLDFSRYSAPTLRSCALRAFNERETEINQHYWSFVVVSEFSGYRARRFRKIDPSAPTTRLFRASGPDSSRIPRTVSDWLSANDALQNWLRLSALVSAAANLEMYLGHVIRTALFSDPFVVFGKPRALDGVTLLKQGIELPYSDLVEGVTKGDWNSRSSVFAKAFGVCLLVFQENKAALEDIRNTRNSFAHGFGRELSIPEPGILSDGGTAKLSQEKLKRCLGVISKAAREIDRFLMDRHIGGFELIHLFHRSADSLGFEVEPDGMVARALKVKIYQDFGITVTEKFCRSVIGHYRDAPGH